MPGLCLLGFLPNRQLAGGIWVRGNGSLLCKLLQLR
jgi:hypothetical protein